MNIANLEQAISQIEADLSELKAEIPTWNSINIYGTNKYRPIAKRIVLSAKRIEELVKENTYQR